MKKSGPTLALFGGQPEIKRPFQRYNSIGKKEEKAAIKVLKSGNLSQFIGAWDPDFFGGPKVREFEIAFQEHFKVDFAVSMNSLSSVLTAAVGALGIAPGDEVITSPWTMSATAMAILQWNAIPVFADIDPENFNLDPSSIESCISERTKAIIVPDIFGQSAKVNEIMSIANRYDLEVISDSAQSPGAEYFGEFAGTLTDIGGFSLNYHKHIHTGEGGVAVTNDANLASRLQMLRNHAESVVGARGITDLNNMIGQNYRMGEIEAAIGTEQLKKLPHLVLDRQRVARALDAGLNDLAGLKTHVVPEGMSHSYYVYPMTYNPEITGVDRTVIVKALRAEGVPAVASGYQLIHQLPIFQNRIAYGGTNFPWSLNPDAKSVDYRMGTCPVAERLHERTFLGIGVCQFQFTSVEIDFVVAAFGKVWRHLEDLRDYGQG